MQHGKAIRELAVTRIRNGGAPLLDLAREYGVSTNTLRAWMRESDLRRRSQEEARRAAASLSGASAGGSAQRDRLLIHAIEHSPATIIVTDTGGRIVYANPKFAETTGYAVEEAIGKNPRILKSGATSSLEYRKLWKTILSGNEWRGTFRNRRKDGSLYWERASISPVFSDDGRITHFMAIKEDITGLVEAEIVSRRQAALCHAVLTALPGPTLLIDSNGLVLYANAAAETLCGDAIAPPLPFRDLNLRWIDENQNALTNATHPATRMLKGDRAYPPDGAWSRIGVIPPTGGVAWVDIFLRRVDLPEARAPAVILSIAPTPPHRPR